MWEGVVARAQHGVFLPLETSAQAQGRNSPSPRALSWLEASPTIITSEACQAPLLRRLLLDKEIKPGAPVPAEIQIYTGGLALTNAPVTT